MCRKLALIILFSFLFGKIKLIFYFYNLYYTNKKQQNVTSALIFCAQELQYLYLQYSKL